MDKVLQEIFIQEAEENLEVLENTVIRLENDTEDINLINDIFRAMHSIKGSAGLAGFPKIKEFSHQMEDLFEEIRNGSLKIEESIISLILESIDSLKVMISNIKDKKDALETLNIQNVYDQISQIKNLPKVSPLEKEKCKLTRYYHLDLEYYPGIFASGIDPLMFLSDLKESGEILVLEVNGTNAPDMQSFNPEELYLKWSLLYKNEGEDISEIFCFVQNESNINITDLSPHLEEQDYIQKYSINGKTIRDFIQNHSLPDSEANLPKQIDEPHQKSSMHVSTGKLEQIYDTVSELVIAQAHLNTLGEEYNEEIPESFTNIIDSLNDLTGMLQDQITSLRMISLYSSFNRLKRIVRDTASELGKTISFQVEGQDTELDKTMIERLNDPLKHIIRNCIDHGIETRTERLAAGKTEEGIIKLSAFLDRGKVIIEISDDGMGLNKEKLRARAEEMGLIHSNKNLDDSEIYNLIFHPGLSTSDQVSDLSGRGVGMDVVMSRINELQGNIEVISHEGQGICFRLSLPLTLAILDGMLVSIGNEHYMIPTLSILEIFRPMEDQVKTLSGGDELVYFRDEYIPVIRLHQIFDIQGSREDVTQAQLIVVYNGSKKAAILVDSVQDQFQIVLKSLQENFQRVKHISSATILGSGDVVLILDIQSLMTQKVLYAEKI